jgi:hypothetical protein
MKVVLISTKYIIFGPSKVVTKAMHLFKANLLTDMKFLIHNSEKIIFSKKTNTDGYTQRTSFATN